jgi:hypothetical protein
MSNATDMSTPVTRSELREELKRFATKTDLEVWGGALGERIAESHEKLSAKIAESHEKLSAKIAESHEKLSAELARHAKAHDESTSRLISVLDDKYESLPDRVTCLEDAVFPVRQR